MSLLLNANQIAEESLRIIGAYTINESAARPEELERALFWLDICMAEISGRRKLWWLVPQSITVDLTSGTSNYLLSDILAEKAPDGFAFPVTVKLVRNSLDLPVVIIPRHEYDEKQNKATEGTPVEVHFDRQREMQFNLYPVPNEDGLQLKITFQTFPPSVTGKDENDHGLRVAWQLWAMYQVAFHIGNGPVRRLDTNESNRNGAIAQDSRDALMAIDNRERHDKPHQVARVDY